ncbi:MAG TPA: hypothetical protein VIY48_05445, partial [Candidatus Paceibacterota bacterium]
MFYEVIYETGTHSVIFAESDEDALPGLNEHHRRAVEGEEGGPTGHAAERIKKVLKYEEHPMATAGNQNVNADGLKEMVNTIIEEKGVGGEVSVPEVAAAIRQLTSPVALNNDPHESDFIASEVGELKGDWSN